MLLYEALGGPFYPERVRETMLDDPPFAADVDTPAAVIRDAYADVVWDADPDAASYRLHGYGGYDPDFYGAGPIDLTVWPGSYVHDHQDAVPAGEIWLSLSGLWGPADGEAEAVGSMESRFATGWIWEVEIFHDP